MEGENYEDCLNEDAFLDAAYEERTELPDGFMLDGDLGDDMSEFDGEN